MDQPRRDVDGGWAWMVFLASFMNLLLSSGIAFVSGIFQKLFLEHFHQSVAYTAWVTALFNSLLQFAGPLAGWLTSVTNCRVTVMVGGALLSGGLAASSFATSLHYLLVSFGLLAGLGLGLMYTPSIVIVNFFFDRRRTLVVGVALSASGIGVGLTPMLSRFLIDQFSWQETMMILAAIAAHVCVFGAVMFPVHEPRSSCLRHRGRLPRPEVVDPDCGVDVELRDVVLEEGSVVHIPENVDGELKADVDDSAERDALLEKTSTTKITESEHLKPMPHADCDTVQFSQDSGPTFQTLPPQHRGGSRQSLNETSHRVNGASGSPHTHQRLSHSAHHLDKPQAAVHHTHHPRQTTGSVQTLGGRGTPRGSHLDVLAVSLSSSVYSLHGGGLPTEVDTLTSSSHQPGPVVDSGGGESGGNAGGGGGGGGVDWMVLKNVSFLLLCLNMCFGNMAISVFTIHLPAFCQQRGVDDQDITIVIALFGAGLFVSRILLGAMVHDPRVDQVTVYFGLHIISSCVQVFLPFTQSLAGIAALTFLMGIYYGSVYTLTSALTISVVGLSSLAFAFGLVMISAGLGYLVAPPLAGWIVDKTGDYDNSMYLGGVTMFFSAIPVLCLTCRPGRRPGSPLVGPFTRPPDTDLDRQLDQREQNGAC